MRVHISLIPERFQFTKHLDVAVLLDFCLRRLVLVRVHLVYANGGGVGPLLNFDLSGAVVDFVRDVDALRADIADLSDEEDARCIGTVDVEIGFGVWLCGIKSLFNCDWAEGWVVGVTLQEVAC